MGDTGKYGGDGLTSSSDHEMARHIKQKRQPQQAASSFIRNIFIYTYN